MRNSQRRYQVSKTSTVIPPDTEVWLVEYRSGRSADSSTLASVTSVWRHPLDGACWCTRCSGPLSAMSRSCAHARAVQRAARAA